MSTTTAKQSGAGRDGRPAANPTCRIHIVGAASMGLLAAYFLLQSARAHGLRLAVHLYEGRLAGGSPGDDLTSGARCQAWGHSGALYGYTQPHAAATVARSIRLLRGLAPDAFRADVPSLALFRPGHKNVAEEYREGCESLGIQFQPLSHKCALRYAPSLQRVLDDETRVFRTWDTPFDLRLVNSALRHRVRSQGAHYHPHAVEQLVERGGAIRELRLATGDTVHIGPQDRVVLACSNRIPRLLNGVGVSSGIRLFQCQLVATREVTQDVLLAVCMGGPTTVPHRCPDRSLVTIFGNSARQDVALDTERLEVIPEYTTQVLKEVGDHFGLDVDPRHVLVWPALKAEVVGDDDRCQSHYVARQSGLVNVIVALPGKLSGAPAAAQDVARIIVKDLVCDVGRSYWEEVPQTWVGPTVGS